MSAIVSDILTNVSSQAATTLGATWQELQYVHDVTRNHERNLKMAYGVRPLSGVPAPESINRYYTMDHGFEIVLTDSIARQDSDTPVRTSIGTLYNKADELFKALVNTKISLPTTVLFISSPTIPEPEVIPGKAVVVRVQFVVKYRGATT